MDYKAVLLEDLEKGFSKSDLEKLIGLPQNNLSGILKGDRGLSKKSKLKIEKWMASVKPNPLNVFFEPKEKPLKPEILNQRKVFIPKNQPVLDKFGNILVSENKVKKTNSTIKKLKEQFPLEESKTIDRRFGTDIEPAEGTNRFFLKYGAFTYEDAKNLAKVVK